MQFNKLKWQTFTVACKTYQTVKKFEMLILPRVNINFRTL